MPQIAVDAAPPAGWGLPNLIPELGTPAVTSLKFHDAELFWASYTSEVDQTVEGFYVQAAMDLSGPFGVLAAFVDADAPPMLSGQIGVTKVASADGLTVQYLPDALLQADAKSGDVSPDPANKDRLTLSSTQLQLSLSATFNEVDGRWQVRDRMLLKGWMAFKGLWFLCEADVHDPASDILFSVTTDMDIVGAFEELVAWVGPELAVPGLKINDPGSIRLKDLKLAYNPGATGRKITFVCVHVGTAKGEKFGVEAFPGSV